MWKQFTKDGFLQYPNFLETIVQVVPMYRLRAIGGSLYLIGVFMMAFNLYRTAKAGNSSRTPKRRPRRWIKTSGPESRQSRHSSEAGGKAACFHGAGRGRVLIGGLVEIIPMFLVKENVPTISSVKPYTPLEVLGRDIYIREGCLGCHSQMIRPFRSETERYGEYSKAGEFVYDHPFLWGSKRNGPDLHARGRINIPTRGITTTWTIRARLRPAPSCRVTRGC
jgi:cytochrome c oxidase cbb3-type subunit I/II